MTKSGIRLWPKCVSRQRAKKWNKNLLNHTFIVLNDIISGKFLRRQPIFVSFFRDHYRRFAWLFPFLISVAVVAVILGYIRPNRVTRTHFTSFFSALDSFFIASFQLCAALDFCLLSHISVYNCFCGRLFSDLS